MGKHASMSLGRLNDLAAVIILALVVCSPTIPTLSHRLLLLKISLESGWP